MKIRVLGTILLVSTLLMTGSASCNRSSGYEIVATFNGIYGETTSDPFTITSLGQIELMLLKEITLEGMDVKLYSTDDDSQPDRHATWTATGDRFSDVPPGEYYMVVNLPRIMLPNSLVNQGFNIEIRDRTENSRALDADP